MNKYYPKVEFNIAFKAPNEIGKFFPYKDRIEDVEKKSRVILGLSNEVMELRSSSKISSSKKKLRRIDLFKFVSNKIIFFVIVIFDHDQEIFPSYKFRTIKFSNKKTSKKILRKFDRFKFFRTIFLIDIY